MMRRNQLAPVGTWAASVLAAGLLLGGCNTVAGLGYDVESLGKGVRESADGTRSGINSAVGVEEKPAYTPTQSDLASRKY